MMLLLPRAAAAVVVLCCSFVGDRGEVGEWLVIVVMEPDCEYSIKLGTRQPKHVSPSIPIAVRH